MTTISAKIVLDSINEQGNRLTTMRLHYPRCIHSELMTHRVFSRNSASSRAIPVKRMIEAIRADPFVPIYWGSNKPGMQAGEEINTPVELSVTNFSREDAWRVGLESAIELAEAYDAAGYHKQIINRLLEPWMHISVLVSSTTWSNFLALRAHKDAEPHMQRLGACVFDALMHGAQPLFLKPGEWHLPYVNDDFGRTLEESTILSVARCAHLSYETVEGEPIGMAQAQRIYDKLLGSQPIHASPAEHQATPDTWKDADLCDPWLPGRFMQPELHGNFAGWIQYRKTLAGESA